MEGRMEMADRQACRSSEGIIVIIVRDYFSDGT